MVTACARSVPEREGGETWIEHIFSDISADRRAKATLGSSLVTMWMYQLAAFGGAFIGGFAGGLIVFNRRNR